MGQSIFECVSGMPRKRLNSIARILKQYPGRTAFKNCVKIPIEMLRYNAKRNYLFGYEWNLPSDFNNAHLSAAGVPLLIIIGMEKIVLYGRTQDSESVSVYEPISVQGDDAAGVKTIVRIFKKQEPRIVQS